MFHGLPSLNQNPLLSNTMYKLPLLANFTNGHESSGNISGWFVFVEAVNQD